MATQVQNRRGTTAEHSTFTGAAGEVTVDTDKEVVVVHDGTTAGGYPQMRENGSQNLVTTGSITGGRFIPTSSTVPTNGVYLPAANTVGISTNGTGRLFVDASGRLLLGTGTPASLAGGTPSFYVEGASASTANGAILRTNGAPTFSLVRGSSGNNATSTCGIFLFQGYDGSAYGTLSSISTAVDGSVSSGSTPGTLIFSTTPSGASSATERLRITSDGKLGLGTSDPKERLDVTGGPILTKNVLFAQNQNSAYLIAGTTSYTGATTDWGTYGIQHRFKSNAGGLPRVTIDTSTGELFCVTGEGKVGVGTTPDSPLHVVGTGGTGLRIGYTNNTNYFDADLQVFRPNNGASEYGRWDSSGRLLVGTSSDSGGALFQVNGDRIRVGTAKTPASATATGTAGEICWDASYVYVCTATNTWKRSALSTW